jgi:hexosaminidase
MIRPYACTLLVAVSVASGAAAQRIDAPPPVQPSPMRPMIPLPQKIEPAAGDPFVLGPQTVIYVAAGDAESQRLGKYLADAIGIAAGPEPPRVEPAQPGGLAGGIHLRLGSATRGTAHPEAYELAVDSAAVTISAQRHAGLFYGVQTLRQLLPPFIEYEAVRADKGRPIHIEAVRITDAPRFEWRGSMLDVSRHFFSVDDVKRYIDLISLYKMNRLHLHLADDQGWRIDITSWPNLAKHGGSTEVGGGPGGYYTQAQYSDIVSYARERFITIVPEIDMPGHTNAALASYPELNCDDKERPLYTGIDVGFSALCVDKEVTYRFIDDVVREISALTPTPYFHVGGDEVKTLTPEQYVQFIERVQKIVQSHGKQMVGWDEITPAALLPTTVVQHWRPDGTPTAAVEKGAKVVMSLANRAYLDMKYDNTTPIGLNWAANIEVRDAYDWDPAAIAAGIPEAALLGVEAPLWTETLANMRDVEYMAFPRLPAIAEVGWSRQDARNWEDFRVRLGAHGPRFTALGINFYRAASVPWK